MKINFYKDGELMLSPLTGEPVMMFVDKETGIVTDTHGQSSDLPLAELEKLPYWVDNKITYEIVEEL